MSCEFAQVVSNKDYVSVCRSQELFCAEVSGCAGTQDRVYGVSYPDARCIRGRSHPNPAIRPRPVTKIRIEWCDQKGLLRHGVTRSNQSSPNAYFTQIRSFTPIAQMLRLLVDRTNNLCARRGSVDGQFVDPGGGSCETKSSVLGDCLYAKNLHVLATQINTWGYFSSSE